MANLHSYDHYYEQACEYVVPIKLVVPVFLEPKVYVQSSGCIREKIQVSLEPELHLEPEVKASHPICAPQNGYSKAALVAEEVG
jgi:hypothetical protein